MRKLIVICLLVLHFSFCAALFSDEISISQLVSALSNDGVTGNATQARAELAQLLMDENEQDAARTALEDALTSNDRQLQQNALMVLSKYYQTTNFNPLDWSKPFLSALSNALADDDVPYNATAAEETFVYMLRNDSDAVKNLAHSLLDRALSSENYPKRQRAAQYLIRHRALWKNRIEMQDGNLFAVLIEGMAEWLPYWTGAYRYTILSDLLKIDDPNLQSLIVEQLEKAMDSPVPEIRGFCGILLLEHYNNQGVPEDQWHPKAVDGAALALEDDDVMWNLDPAAMALFRVKGDHVKQKLFEMIDQPIGQGQFNAAYLLAWMVEPGIHPKLSDKLVEHLRADSDSYNGHFAFSALRYLGKGNLANLLTRVQNPDWQQAAFLRFLACIFNVEWLPPETVYPRWKRIADEKREPYYEEVRAGRILATAAMYMTPQSYEGLPEAQYPFYLAQIVKHKTGLKTDEEKINWLKDWVWLEFLQERTLNGADEQHWLLGLGFHGR